MDGGFPRAESTLAIILGSEDFPKAGLSSSLSFRQSATGFREYLLDSDGFGLSKPNLLDLFDRPESGPDLDEEVTHFLTKRASGSNGGVPATDVIVYYVGHGGFGSSGTDYYLALRATRHDNPVMSSYSVQALAKTLKQYASHLRRFVILDSCFSAASYREFQSGPLDAAVQQTTAVLPLRGTALLCASGPRNPAKAPPGEKFTMFTGAMLRSLREGLNHDTPHFSIEQLAEDVEKRIRANYDDEAVRPEVHFPNQPEGVIGRVPIFPNPKRSTRTLQLRLSALEPSVAALKQELTQVREQTALVATSLQQVQSELGKLKEIATSAQSVRIDLDGSSVSQRGIGGQLIKESEWQRLPGHIKKMMLNAQRARLQGIIWLFICLMASGLLFYELITRTLGSSIWKLSIAIVTVLGLINSVAVSIDIRRGMLTSSAESDATAWWEDLEAVVALKTVHTVTVFPGFRVTGALLYSASIVCLITIVAAFSDVFSGLVRIA
jgi:uncharacterized caspase-like protein